MDCHTEIPWETLVIEQYLVTVITGSLLVVVLALFCFRKWSTSRHMDPKTATLTFNSIVRTCCNLTSFSLQLPVLIRTLDSVNCKSTLDIDLYIISIFLTLITHVTECFLRQDIDAALFAHHFVAMTMVTLLLTDTGSHNNTFSPITDYYLDGYVQAWEATISIGVAVGLFNSTSVTTDVPMVLYHLLKDRKPVLISKVLSAGFVLNLSSKITVHTLFWILYARHMSLLPVSLRILGPILAVFFMVTEYYFCFVFAKITVNHRKKRVDKQVHPAQEGLETNSVAVDVENQQTDLEESSTTLCVVEKAHSNTFH